MSASAGAAPPSCVLLVDADGALAALLGEWLAEDGCAVVHARGSCRGVGADPGCCDAPAAAGRIDLAIIELPNPRETGARQVQRVAQAHPGRPILALSPQFFAGIDCHGALARQLGVACVLPMPAPRDAVLRAVRRLLGR